MNEHSRLPPSSAARRVACPGSRALEERYPEEQESSYAKEGHLAHYIAVKTLKAYLEGNNIDFSPEFDNVPITDEMQEGAELYANHIVETLKGTAGTLHIEERIDISSIHPDCWGTPDCWMINGVGNELHVWDYKYGHGFVEVFENWQLIEYAAGILQQLNINGIQDQFITVNFHIVQPRSYHKEGHIRTWRITASGLRPYFNILISAEAAASLDSTYCIPNPECSYCLGRHSCPALQDSALKTVDMVRMNTSWNLGASSTGNELRYLKRAAELLDARITGLEEQTTAMIKRGEQVPFFKLEPGGSRDKWNKSAQEVITLGTLLGHDLAKPQEAITPKQAIKAGMPVDVINSYTERTPGGLKLVADDGMKARKIFGKNKL